MESISCFFFVGGAHGVMETGINCMWGDQIVEAVQNQHENIILVY